VSELLFLLAGDKSGQDIVMKGKIGTGRERPPGHDDETANGNPKREGAKPNLPAGMDQRIVGAPAPFRPRLRPDRATGIGTISLPTDPLRHRRSPTARPRSRGGASGMRFQPGMVNFPRRESAKCVGQ